MKHKALEINANPHQFPHGWRMGVTGANAFYNPVTVIPRTMQKKAQVWRLGIALN